MKVQFFITLIVGIFVQHFCYSGEINGIVYDYNRGQITITRYTNPKQLEVVVPSEIEDMPVTKLAPYAFSSHGAVKITLPNTIIELGGHCFSNCEAITQFEIPDGVSIIPDSCFNFCRNLEKITIPDSVRIISSSAFYHCIRLRDINWNYGVQIIEELAFKDCQSLTEITFPGSLRKLEGNSFHNCDSLKVIRWGDRSFGPLEFDPYPFRDCDRVQKIYIPEKYHNALYAERLWLDYIYPDGFFTPEAQPAATETDIHLKMVPAITLKGTTGAKKIIERAGSVDGPWHPWKSVVLTEDGSTLIDLEPGDAVRFYRIRP